MASSPLPSKKGESKHDSKEHSEIVIADLYAVSLQLLEPYFINHDLYSLLVLALVTITEYSRDKKHKHLSTDKRIELAITYTPDLVKYLVGLNKLTSKTGSKLLRLIERRAEDIPQIFQAYVYASAGLRTKLESGNTEREEVGVIKCSWKFW